MNFRWLCDLLWVGCLIAVVLWMMGFANGATMTIMQEPSGKRHYWIIEAGPYGMTGPCEVWEIPEWYIKLNGIPELR